MGTGEISDALKVNNLLAKFCILFPRINHWQLYIYIYIYVYVYMCVCVCVCVYCFDKLNAAQKSRELLQSMIFQQNQSCIP
jgi:hypothetical protein